MVWLVFFTMNFRSDLLGVVCSLQRTDFGGEIYLQTVPCLPRALAVRNRRGYPSGRWVLWKARTVCTGVCVGRMLCDEDICSLRLWFCFKILQASKQLDALA